MTVDSETLANQSVTVRERDTLLQERINIADLKDHLRRKIEG
jgi:glycyl-tRNA synthetase (class II)